VRGGQRRGNEAAAFYLDAATECCACAAAELLTGEGLEGVGAPAKGVCVRGRVCAGAVLVVTS